MRRVRVSDQKRIPGFWILGFGVEVGVVVCGLVWFQVNDVHSSGLGFGNGGASFGGLGHLALLVFQGCQGWALWFGIEG